MEEQKNGRASALLPILVFLLIFLGSGLLTGDFYSMPAIVAFLLLCSWHLSRTAVCRLLTR